MKHGRVTLPIYNLGCGGGSTVTIERALAESPGVLEAYVNPLTEMVYVVYDPVLVDTGQFARVIDQLGYGSPRAEANSIQGYGRQA